MASPFVQALRRSQYTVGSAAKVGWYTWQYMATRHLAGPLTEPGHVPKPFAQAASNPREIRKAFFELFEREAADISNGVYRMPREFRRARGPLSLLTGAQRTLREARAIAQRRHRAGGATEARALGDDELPAYYKQNFHYQTDGWLSDKSARVYDDQVESIFTGAAGAMRRRMLPPLLDALTAARTKGTARPVVVDLACGTAPLMVDVLDNVTGAEFHAVDLSEPYLNAAAKRLPSDRVAFHVANAEALPFADASVDILYTVYLFHELPAVARDRVAAEIARVLKPGGIYLHADSVQYGDTPMDLLLEGFPRAVHEPYYDAYCKTPLADQFGEAPLHPTGREEVAFLTKVTEFQRAAA